VQGGSVMATPHFGNIYSTYLTLLELGIPVVCFDWTLGNKDQLFYPHGVVYEGRFHLLAQEDRLTTHTTVARPLLSGPFAVRKHFEVGGSMLRAHDRALREAFPAADIRTWSSLIAGERDLFLSILDRVHAEFGNEALDLWYRFVDRKGNVRRMSPSSWSRVREDIFRLTNSREGWVLPLSFTVLLGAVLQNREASGRRRVFHLSGPDMIGYIGEMKPLLQRFAEPLGAYCTRNEWEFTVVPAAHFRFATLSSKAAALDELWDAVLELERCDSAARGTLGACAEGERAGLIREAAAGRKRVTERLRAAAQTCPEVFLDLRRQHSPSQYDLLGSGAGLYALEPVKGMPSGEVRRLWDNAHRIVKAVL
jgi:hypothetical protein